MKTGKPTNLKIRYNIITTFTYIIGIVLLIQLFNLQIVKGEEYRQTSNTRLSRESVLKAARGNITDNRGTILVGTTTSHNLEVYKSKIDNNTLNQTLLKVANVLEQNNSKYIDNFPITINPFSFTYNNVEREKKWKKANKICDARVPFGYALTGTSTTFIPGKESFCSLNICIVSSEIFCAIVTDFVEL